MLIAMKRAALLQLAVLVLVGDPPTPKEMSRWWGLVVPGIAIVLAIILLAVI